MGGRAAPVTWRGRSICTRAATPPTTGSAFYFGGTPEHPAFTFAFDSCTHPFTLLHHDLRTGESRRLGMRDTGHDSADYVTRQLFFRSKDGTRVPMFVTHRANLTPNGETPPLLYGYGATGAVEEPIFRDDWFTRLESGGILAVANPRGGGEYGEAWREAYLLAFAAHRVGLTPAP